MEAVIETQKRISVHGNILRRRKAKKAEIYFRSPWHKTLVVSLHIDKLTSIKDTALGNILQKHAKVFLGLGKLKGQKIKLDIDKTQTPKAQPQRRISYHI